MAVLVPDARFNKDVYTLDLYAYLDYWGFCAELLRALRWPERKVQAYADELSPEKTALFREWGFREEARLARQLRTPEGRELDVFIWSRG